MKKTVEIVLVKAEFDGIPEKRLPLSRNLGCVELIWPRCGVARKSAAREFVYRRGKCDFQDELWCRRCLFREEIDAHCGIAVSITEPVSIQKFRRVLQLTAKYAFKEGGDIAAGLMTGYGDIASAPFDAVAQIVGEKGTPRIIAQGVIDYRHLPGEEEKVILTVPLQRPGLFEKTVGSLTIEVRG